MNRREFVTSIAALPAAAAFLRAGETPDASLKARPFRMQDVRIAGGPFLAAQEADRRLLRDLPADRLVHNFKLNAGLPSAAQPLGGWEKPDCEVRGHFTGHYLSACALMYASAGDEELKRRGDTIVAELARCQDPKDGYLSAFPREFWLRLKAQQKVWVPFYTIHKILAGMLDMHEHCGNQQALRVAKGMANWVDQWSAPLDDAQMQMVLDTEFGGMAEGLWNLHGVTGDPRWAQVARRFEKRKFLDPLALRRDELKGLHANTHVPQAIGAARRYELSGERRYHDIAEYFWHEVTSARCYCTGGTSNNEFWLTDPLHLAEELAKGASTTECCVSYNMMKLTRHLYSWTADPRYFDYYERTLYNHRLPAIDPQTGATMYYLPLNAMSWKTFATEFDSFWCCTGTGVEEFAKLNDSIYFHDGSGIFVNLFIPSRMNWASQNFALEQTTDFPVEPSTKLTVRAAPPGLLKLSVRIPAWTSNAQCRVNGKLLEATAEPGSYLTIGRHWKAGDTVELDMPMTLRAEAMPDDPNLAAILYGPIVLAGEMGTEGMGATVGPMGPDIKPMEIPIPELGVKGEDVGSALQPLAGRPLRFRAPGGRTLAPLYSVFGQRYAIYWRLS